MYLVARKPDNVECAEQLAHPHSTLSDPAAALLFALQKYDCRNLQQLRYSKICVKQPLNNRQN